MNTIQDSAAAVVTQLHQNPAVAGNEQQQGNVSKTIVQYKWLQANTCKVMNKGRGFHFINFNGSFDPSEADSLGYG